MKTLYIQDGVPMIGFLDAKDFIAKNQEYLAANRVSYGEVSDEVMQAYYDAVKDLPNQYALLVDGKFTHNDAAIVETLRPFGVENYEQVSEYYGGGGVWANEMIVDAELTHFFRYFGNEDLGEGEQYIYRDLCWHNLIRNDEGQVGMQLVSLSRQHIIDEILRDLD